MRRRPVLAHCMATGLFLGAATLALPGNVLAQMPDESHVTTERSCGFMMAKGEKQQHCEVPMMQGCVVAHFPGTTAPWTSISKGGKTACRFDQKQSDWKTRIVGTCSQCTSEQCSVTFHVKLDCSPR